jgi:ketosteroid isomerase-like protein
VSKANVEIATRAIALLNPRDYADLRLYSPEFTYRPLASFTETKECRGLGEYLRFGEGFFETWADDFELRVTDARDHGDVVSLRIEFSGHARASGIEISDVVFRVLRLRDGLITRAEDFATSAEALRAAGLEE